MFSEYQNAELANALSGIVITFEALTRQPTYLRLAVKRIANASIPMKIPPAPPLRLPRSIVSTRLSPAWYHWKWKSSESAGCMCAAQAAASCYSKTSSRSSERVKLYKR